MPPISRRFENLSDDSEVEFSDDDGPATQPSRGLGSPRGGIGGTRGYGIYGPLTSALRGHSSYGAYDPYAAVGRLSRVGRMGGNDLHAFLSLSRSRSPSPSPSPSRSRSPSPLTALHLGSPSTSPSLSPSLNALRNTQQAKPENVQSAVVSADAILRRASDLLSKRETFGSGAGSCSRVGAAKSSATSAKDFQAFLHASDLDEDGPPVHERQTDDQQLKEALQTQKRRCKELEAENQKLNKALQIQHQEIRHLKEAMVSSQARETMLLSQYDKLQDEHRLLTSQFHLEDFFSAAPRASATAAASDPFAAATANTIARAQARLPQDLQSFLEASDSDDDSFGVPIQGRSAITAPKEIQKAAIVVARSQREPKPSSPSHLLDEASFLPNEFFCPITWDVMTDPVLAMDGYTYELEAIVQWFKGGKGISPMTKEKLPSFLLVPNRAIRAQIIAANDSKSSKAALDHAA